MRDLTDLEVYKACVDIRQHCFKLCQGLPKEEKYLLRDQLVRSTRKAPANIAEGHGRFHFQENIQYCRIARGSLTEAQDHLSVALECNYIDQSTIQEIDNKIRRAIQLLNGYIRYLNKEKQKKL